MKKTVDGRTAKGLRIRAQVRGKILGSYIDLIRMGNPTPTARETAAHARLSLRVIFKHFPNLAKLRAAAIAQIEAQGLEFYGEPISYADPVEERMRRFVESQTQMLEIVAPFRRAALVVESVDPFTAAAMRRVRHAAVAEIERVLGPTLEPLSSSERRDLVFSLHTVCAWPSWETLRSHHRLSPPRARQVINRLALATLREHLRPS